MVEVISGPNVLWQLYRSPGITRAFRQKGHPGHREHKTLGHFTSSNKQEIFIGKTQYAGKRVYTQIDGWVSKITIYAHFYCKKL